MYGRLRIAAGLAVLTLLPACGSNKAETDDPLTPFPSPSTIEIHAPPSQIITLTPTPSPRANSRRSSTTLKLPRYKRYEVVQTRRADGSFRFTLGVNGAWYLLWAYRCSPPVDGDFVIYDGWSSDSLELVDLFGGAPHASWADDVDARPHKFVGKRRLRISVPDKGCRILVGAAI